MRHINKNALSVLLEISKSPYIKRKALFGTDGYFKGNIRAYHKTTVF